MIKLNLLLKFSTESFRYCSLANRGSFLPLVWCSNDGKSKRITTVRVQQETRSEHVTSHKKTFLTVCRFGTDSCVYAVYKPFERLGLSVRKNLHPFARLRLSVQKKFASIRTAWAICAKNIVIRSKKIDICSNGSSYPFKTIIIISRRFHLSCSRLGRSGRSHATNLSKNVNDLMQALC